MEIVVLSGPNRNNMNDKSWQCSTAELEDFPGLPVSTPHESLAQITAKIIQEEEVDEEFASIRIAVCHICGKAFSPVKFKMIDSQ